jgi:hypothetical protein
MDSATDQSTAVDVGPNGDKTLQVMGNRCYWRKTYTPDVTDGVGCLVLPDKLKDHSVIVEIVAVGPDCGKLYKDPEGYVSRKVKRKLNKWPVGINNPIKVGDFCILKNGCQSITHPFGYELEGMISEFDILAVLEG